MQLEDYFDFQAANDIRLKPVIAAQLHKREPGIQAFAIGWPGVPPISMPGHLRDYLSTGKHIPGLFITPFPLSIGSLIEELILLWGASLPSEFQDQIVCLPLGR